MATTLEIAQQIAALVKQEKYKEAVDTFYSPNIVSTEPGGDPATVSGIEAIYGKVQWWENAHQTNSIEVGEPRTNGNQFIIEYRMNITLKATGMTFDMNEFGLYTVEDGKIVDEKFFYNM